MDFLCSPAAEGGDALTGKASQLDPQKFAYAAIIRSTLDETTLQSGYRRRLECGWIGDEVAG
jgi:hypothetical protein